MSNSIERVETPSGATHKTPKGTYMKHAAGAWFEWLHEWVKVDSGVHVKVNQLTEISGDGMNLKKLTQAVFQGLPVKYRWAKILENGDAVAGKKYEHKETLLRIGKGFDATDWQNSKIERRDVPTEDIDWSRQDVPEGATHYAIQDGVVAWLKDDYSFWNVWEDGAWAACGIPVAQPIPTTPEPQVDWSKAPKWAQAAVMNANGVWSWVENASCFAKLPNNGWREYGMFKAIENADISSEKSKWPESKLLRPESITDVARSIEAARVAEQSERTYPHYFKDVSDVDAIDLYHVARMYDITDPALFHAFKKIACAGKRGAKDQAQDVQEAIDALKRWQELNV